MKHSQYVEYEKDIYRAFSEAKNAGKGVEDIREDLRTVFNRYSSTMGKEFHHLHTELAFLKIRHNIGNKDIVPILLNGEDYHKCFPEYVRNDKSRLRVEMNDKRSLQSCFFKLLGMVANDYKVFIDRLQATFDDCVTARTSADPETFKADCEVKFLNELMQLTSDQKLRGVSPRIEISAVWLGLDAYYSKYSFLNTVSGRALRFDSGYVDLTVVKYLKSKELKKQEHNTSQREANLRSPISLDNIFQETDLQDGSKGRPKRVLLRGRPGAGKSTLCKRIAYDFRRADMFQEMFDWVLWVPLRKLELVKDLEDFLYQEYFQLTPHGDKLAKMLYDRILGQSKARTLLILDGWDETRGWTQSKNDLVARLVDHDPVIITSRFSGSFEDFRVPVDLDLEVVGFSEEQAMQYVKNQDLVQSKEDAHEIGAFIKSNKNVSGLVQIPIHLDALCYSWDELKQNKQVDNVPTTTILYQAIEQKLWRMSIPKLHKTDPIDMSVVTKEIVDAVHDWKRLERSVKQESDFLCGLAMQLIKEKRTEFDDQYIDKIIQQIECCNTKLPLSLERNLKSLPFLHSDQRGRQCSYSFIHLTFQEYFAALWLIRHMPEMNQYIQQFKYNPRFERVWSFAVGLLQASVQLQDLFSAIEREPRDVLGPAHQRLVMQCLSEVVPSKEPSFFTSIRESLEDQLSQWLLFECKFMERSLFVSEMEFPVRLLDNALREGSKDAKAVIIQSLLLRPYIALSTMELAVSFLEDDVSENKENSFPLMFWTQSTLPESCLEVFTKRLENPDVNVKLTFTNILLHRSTLPERILEVVAKQLKNSDTTIRDGARSVLKNRSDLSEKILETLTKHLEDSDESIRYYAYNILNKQSTLSENILETLTKHLESLNTDIKKCAMSILLHHSTLPKKILGILAKQLESSDIHLRSTVKAILNRQTVFSKTLMRKCLARLRAVDRLIPSHKPLSENVLEVLANQLENSDKNAKLDAVDALNRQSALPEKILEILTKHPENPDIDFAIVSSLCHQSILPEKILEILTKQLERSDINVKPIVCILKIRKTLSENVLELLTKQLESSKDMKVKSIVVDVLKTRNYLPEKTLEVLIRFLEDSSLLHVGIMDVLKSQSTLSEKILEDVALRLGRVGAVGCMEFILLKHDRLYSRFPKFSKEVMGSLYTIWLRRSFENHLSCYFKDGRAYVETPESIREIPLTDDSFKEVVEETQTNLDGYPLYGNADVECNYKISLLLKDKSRMILSMIAGLF